MTVAFSVDGGQAAGAEPGFGQGLIDQRDEHLAHQRADETCPVQRDAREGSMSLVDGDISSMQVRPTKLV